MDERTLEKAAQATARERLLIARARGYDAPMAEPAAQLEALASAVAALASAGISHALIGGLAVGVVTGIPRATINVDLAIPSGVDRQRLIAVMQAAGFKLTGEHPHSVNFRHPSGEPLQLASDPQFDPMLERAEPLSVGRVEVRVVTRDDLIAMKRRAAQDPARRRSKALRDQADVELLLGDLPEPDEGW